MVVRPSSLYDGIIGISLLENSIFILWWPCDSWFSLFWDTAIHMLIVNDLRWFFLWIYTALAICKPNIITLWKNCFFHALAPLDNILYASSSILWLETHLILQPLLTHWVRDKMAAISQTTLSNAFSRMEMLEFRLKFQWSLFLRFQLMIFQHWFR